MQIDLSGVLFVLQLFGTFHLTQNLVDILLNLPLLSHIFRILKNVHDLSFLLPQLLLEPVQGLEPNFADGAQLPRLEGDPVLLLLPRLELGGSVEQLLEHVSVGVLGMLDTVGYITAAILQMTT